MTNVINFPTNQKPYFIVYAYDESEDDNSFDFLEEVAKFVYANIDDAISQFKSLAEFHDDVELYTINHDLIESTHDFNNFEDAKHF